jgi:copper chaperone CopZ
METRIKVKGMTCQHCVKSVKTALEALPEVQSAVPSLDTGYVTIEGDPVDRNALGAAVRSAGYQVVD